MNRNKLLLAFPLLAISQIQASTPPNNVPARLQDIENRLTRIEAQLKTMQEKQEIGVPLDQSMLSISDVIDWTTKSIESIYKYDYQNYSQVLMDIRKYFTPLGYDSYVKALEASKNLQAIQEKKLSVSASSQGPGTVIQEGPVNGIYTWQIQLPIMVKYVGVVQTIEQSLNMKVEVVRVKTSENPKGIAIHSIKAEVAGSPTTSTTPTPK